MKVDPVSNLREAALEIAVKAEEIIGSQEHITDLTVEIRLHGKDLAEVYIHKTYIFARAFQRRITKLHEAED